MENESGDWLPILEYAMKRSVSISTLRRRIRSNQIQFRLEKGKYLIWDEGARPSADRLEARLNQLETDLQRAHEEITELKMLIALYEEKIPARSNA